MRLHVISWFLLAVTALRAAPEYPARGPDIYDPQADGFALIATGLQQAASGHRRVLLDFGANWCPWCHRLLQVFTTDESVRRLLTTGYVLVLIDVNQRKGTARNAAVDAKYGNPIREGLPVLVVLDDAGRPLVTQETGAFEQGGATEAHDPAKVRAFLELWAPPAQSPP